jgi:hypothetical protein
MGYYFSVRHDGAVRSYHADGRASALLVFFALLVFLMGGAISTTADTTCWGRHDMLG